MEDLYHRLDAVNSYTNIHKIGKKMCQNMFFVLNHVIN